MSWHKDVNGGNYGFQNTDIGNGNLKRFKSGSVRTKDADDHRFDLVSPFGLFRLAKIYAEGAKKYGDRNWELGQPTGDVLNHAERHLQLWKQGDRSEDHLAKVAWGMFAIMHYEETLPENSTEMEIGDEH